MCGTGVSHTDPSKAETAYVSRGVRNTLWLYVRTIVLAVSDVLAVRLVLGGLGVEGYGVYSSVYGAAAILLCLNGTLTVTGRRFLSARLVSGREAFLGALRTLLLMAAVMSALIVVCGETFAADFVRAKLSLPPGSEGTARSALHFVVWILVFRMMLTPLSAAIVAAERMRLLAALAVVESATNFGAALLVTRSGLSTPVVYAGLVLAAVALQFAAYLVCCGRTLGLPKVKFGVNMRNLREQGGFFAWMSSAAIANMLKYQGVCTLLGVYAGTAFSGTWSATMKVGIHLYGVAACLHSAFFPMSVKMWEKGDRRSFANVASVSFWGSLCVTALFASPFMVMPEFSLRLCVGLDLPPEAALFMRCMAVHFVIDAMKCPVHAAVLATGRVAFYQTVDSVVMASGFVLAWIGLAAGIPAWTSVAFVAATNALSFVFRFAYMTRATGIGPSEFFFSAFRRRADLDLV